MFTTSGTYPWSFVTQVFHSGQVSHSVVFLVFHFISKKKHVEYDNAFNVNVRNVCHVING